MNTYKSEEFLSASIDRFGDSVYRLALCRLGSEADAEDVFQEVFLRLFKSNTDFNDNEHLKAWLLRVTIQRCNDFHRAVNRRQMENIDDCQELGADIPQDYSELWSAVNSLPDNQRTAVHLFYAEGYSTEEIAEVMDCQPSTVRTWLHRGRKELKTMLEEDCYE